MHPSRFDAFARSLTGLATRRAAWRNLGVALAAGLLPRQPVLVGAKKKTNKNQFGCLNVGQKCRGKDRKCCSGICEGKKPKRGEKDRSRCAGHDANGCLAGQSPEGQCGGTTVVCTTSVGNTGNCYTTTGNAAYCADNAAIECAACTKDVDCQAICGGQAACVHCAGCPQRTACVGIAASNTCRVDV